MMFVCFSAVLNDGVNFNSRNKISVTNVYVYSLIAEKDIIKFMSFDLQIECFSEKSTWRLSVLSYTRGQWMFCSAVWV